MRGPGAQETAIYKKIQNYVFKFSSLLGQGNFSKVYTGTNELTNEIVAIKIVELESLKSKKLEELLFSEIDVLKKLNHPSVLRCFDVFTSNRNCYIVTELCNEGDLESKLRKQRSFPEARAQSYIRDIFEGLVYLNENQVIHRDIKVANIFIHNGKAKIADFGFAKFTKDKFKDMSIGSPLYMSPEGFVNNIYGPKTDVWAFGVLIYELLHGYTPYSDCKTENELRQSLSIPITRTQIKGEVSNELKDVILACMEVDESKRISVPELRMLPYFRRHPSSLFVPSGQRVGQGSSDRIQERFRIFTGNANKPESAIQGNYTQQPRKENEAKSPIVSPFFPQNHSNKNIMELPTEKSGGGKERRAISSQRTITAEFPKSIGKEQVETAQTPKSLPPKLRILSGVLSFKECVSILHYGRLIFKFLLTLKVSSYSNNNELFRLARWLMDLLGQIQEKIERKDVMYEGDNAGLREKKLREVRDEYYKKYCVELESYIQPHEQFGEAAGLDYIISFCYNICQKYDGLIGRDSSTTLLMLAHSVLLIYHTTKLIKDCYDSKNFTAFSTYKEVESFLALKKEQITIDSYLASRTKLIAF